MFSMHQVFCRFLFELVKIIEKIGLQSTLVETSSVL